MKILLKISCIAGMLLMGTMTTVLAQIPGMPYMAYVQPIIPATITLGQNATYMVASVYDTDYLPYTTPTTVAATGAKAADGTADGVTVNVQGSISTTGVTVYIPATATGDGTLQAFSNTITIPAAMTEDGISRNLTLSWASQPYTDSTISITATLKAVGGMLNTKKLDINGGLGNDYLGVLLGAFTYPYNNAGNTSTYQVRNIAGIPDRMFGKYDIGNTTTYEHNFIYVPVVGEDGRIWLNNNLGALYSDINSSSFSPATQATAYNDYDAYGSLFQWGRCPDGHELRDLNYTADTTNTLSTTDTPNSALFIVSNKDWRSTENSNLWQGEAGTNNPCPSGYRVPTMAEFIVLADAAQITTRLTAAASALRISTGGFLIPSLGQGTGTGFYGYYWTTESYGGGSYVIQYWFGPSYNTPSSIERAAGCSVRCIKN